MKFQICVFALLFSGLALANQERLTRRIIRMSRDIHQLSIYNADDLSQREKRSLVRKLRQAKNLLLGRVDGERVCKDQGRLRYQDAIRALKFMAMSAVGLEMTEGQALNFARNWATKFRCELANRYSRDTKDLRVFSGAATGLNLNERDSILFSRDMTQRFCGDRNFRNDFYDTFSFASSASGLNLPIEQAREYAKRQLLEDHFSCYYGEFTNP